MSEPSIELLRELVELESPTGDTRAARDRLADELRARGGAVTVDGDHVSAAFAGSKEPLLLSGHFDTVWPRGTLAQMPWRVEDGRAYGPGVYDMKAGIVVLLEAIRLADTQHELRVVLGADEEIGSPGSRELLARAAEGAVAAFVVEPPTPPRGDLKTARKGLGRFKLTVTGRAAHAGEPADGVSAIDELARLILRVHALNDSATGVSANVGVVAGGTRENVVAAEASAWIDVRVPTLAQRERLDEWLHTLQPEAPGTTLALEGRWTRPPLERTPGNVALFEQAREHGRALGLDLAETSASGGSDGNLIAALGVPVLDGLGAEGDGAHAVNEHVVLDSLAVRAQLLAALLRNPGLPP
jgi:glutamate carboxypeptidase